MIYSNVYKGHFAFLLSSTKIRVPYQILVSVVISLAHPKARRFPLARSQDFESRSSPPLHLPDCKFRVVGRCWPSWTHLHHRGCCCNVCFPQICQSPFLNTSSSTTTTQAMYSLSRSSFSSAPLLVRTRPWQDWRALRCYANRKSCQWSGCIKKKGDTATE